MKAAVLSELKGLDKLSITNIELPVKKANELKVKVKLAGLNPVDVNLLLGKIAYNVSPIPHVPGVELLGEMMEDGRRLKKGDRVIVYPRLSDGSCYNCLRGMEEICDNGGLFGVATDGAYREEAYVDEKYLFSVPDTIGDETAVSLPVGGLTAYHALFRREHHTGKTVLVYGASGNTGIFSVLISGLSGMKVDAVSKNDWIRKYGAENVFRHREIPENNRYDLVINPLGSLEFEDAIMHLKSGGEFVTFGTMGGSKVELDLRTLYTKELSIIGSTGGTRRELKDLIGLMAGYREKIPVGKIFDLDDLGKAIEAFSTREAGRILIRVSS